MNKIEDLGLHAAFGRRTTKADPGTRGPHLNLFSGRLQTAKAAPPAPTAAEEVRAFAERKKLKAEAEAVLRVVVEHAAKSDTPLMADGFEIARAAGIPYDQVASAKNALLGLGVLRTRSEGFFGLDGLVLGDAWKRRNDGGRR